MKMKLLVLLPIAVILSGCAAANISSQSRASGEEGSSKMIRCTSINTGNDTDSELKKYDGWKAVYISEYTTGNKASTSAVLCFEKPYK